MDLACGRTAVHAGHSACRFQSCSGGASERQVRVCCVECSSSESTLSVHDRWAAAAYCLHTDRAGGEPIPGRRRDCVTESRCPSCGVGAADHPLDLPKKLRGLGHICRGDGMGYGYRNGRGRSESEILIDGVELMDESSPLRRAFQKRDLFE